MQESRLDPKFDLLCLQEDEYYFREYACQFSIATKSNLQLNATSDEDNSSIAAAELGVLKLCSSSIYLVPENVSDPVVRIPLDSVATIADPSSSSEAKGPCAIQSSTIIVIQRGLRAVPYKTSTAPIDTFHSTSLNFPPDAKINFLEKIRQLWDITKLRSAGGKEQEYRATEQLHSVIVAHEAGVDFDSMPIEEKQNAEDILEKFRGFRVSPLLVQPGFIVISRSTAYFQPYSCLPSSAATGTQQWKLTNANIKYGQRKFQLRDLALEIFFDKETTVETSSLFVAFNSTEDRNAFQAILIEKTKVASCTPAAGKGPTTTSLRQVTRDWTAGKISNYDYLMQLNEYAGRSFNDLTQYPVFPWVIQDYSSTSLDLHDPGTFRDLSRPIAALNPARVRHGREMYAALQSTGGDDPPWMYGSHYSNPGIVIFYLLRQRPHLMLRLQNGKLDAPDRLFSSISGTWESVLRWNSDVKELIPEFYTLLPSSRTTTGEQQQQQRSFLVNSTGTDFGSRSSGAVVNDVELPPWARTPVDFITKMRAALESPFVSAKLHKWIDLIFGVKQKGSRAVAADNVFHFMTDDETALRYIVNENDVALRSAFEAQIREYGRTPIQLFTKKHPKRKADSRITRMLQACTCGGPVSGAAGETMTTGTRGNVNRIQVVSSRPETLQ
ncbi:putative BEACH domain-containing protein lvsF [Nannochloris sp. 'desiccata']|nr:putative BEACH domain-containing protein lvsF [Chlorella desiccata (nom. nud.)]